MLHFFVAKRKIMMFRGATGLKSHRSPFRWIRYPMSSQSKSLGSRRCRIADKASEGLRGS